MFILFYKFLFFFNDLLEIQRRSFYLFLNFKLGRELSKIQPVINSRKLSRRKNTRLHFSNFKIEKKDKSYDSLFSTSLYFFYENYKFITPSFNIEESIILSKTYCCRFYIPVQLIDSITNFFEIQWIFLGTLPLLTKRGHFIINGTPRVVLNQIIRSPGIYFHKENSKEYDSSRCFYAEIISKQGPWIRLEIDKKKKIWISFQQSGLNRISLPNFFQIFFQKYIDHQFFLREKKKTLNLNGVLLNNFFWKETHDNLQNEYPIQYTSEISLKKSATDFYDMTKKFPNNFKNYTIFFIPLNLKIGASQPDRRSHGNAPARRSQGPKGNPPGRLRETLVPRRGIPFWRPQGAFPSGPSGWYPNIYKESSENDIGLNSTILFASSDRDIDLSLNLGKIGRKRLNQRLGLSLKTLTLTPIDFLAISDILFQLTQNTHKDSINITSTGFITTSLDDIDDLKNRQLKTIGELLQNQMARGIQRLHKTFENVLEQSKKDFKKLFSNYKYPKAHSSLIFLNLFKLEQQKQTLGWIQKVTRSNVEPLNSKIQKNSLPARRECPVGAHLGEIQVNAPTGHRERSQRRPAGALPEGVITNNNNLFNFRSFRKRSFIKRNSYIVRLKKLNLFKTQVTRGRTFWSDPYFKRTFLWNDLFLKNIIKNSIKKKSITSLPKNVFKHFKINLTKEKSLQMSSLFNTQAINSVLKEFFHSHQLSQYLDQSNPLAELTHKRRLSCLGSGGVNRDNAGMEIRGIHVSHYGRICPIETPEGKNAGLVNSLTTTVNINKNGYLETPFCEVFKQHAQNQKKLMFFSSENQAIQNVFFSQKLPQVKNVAIGILNLKTGNFQKCASNWMQLIALNPQQFIAIATTCIPFVEHDDANRALMGSNMQRQALPLMQLEQPLVTTFSAFRVLSDLKDIPTSINSGIILYASQQNISFYRLPEGNISERPHSPVTV